MYIEQTSWPTSLNLMNGLSDLRAGKKTYFIASWKCRLQMLEDMDLWEIVEGTVVASTNATFRT